MKKLINALLILALFFTSCEKTVNDEYLVHSQKEENINGITVHWHPETTDEQQQILRKIIGDMVFVEGGSFVMGATREQIPFAKENEYPSHYVQLSDFYINRYELHPVDVKTIKGEALSQSHSNESIQRKNKLYYTWEDWDEFIKTINRLCGLNFDFPTEAQWEYAARGGQKGLGFVFPGSNSFFAIWNDGFAETDEERPIPNELGLYNLGNQLAEWCKDLYQTYKDEGLATNPCSDWGDLGHVVRGGSFVSKDTISYITMKDYRTCRVSARYYEDYLSDKIGCRLVINKK